MNPKEYAPFEMVRDDALLQPGREILWEGSNGHLIPAVIIQPLPGIAFEVRDLDNGHLVEIYIERIKFVRIGPDTPQVVIIRGESLAARMAALAAAIDAGRAHLIVEDPPAPAITDAMLKDLEVSFTKPPPPAGSSGAFYEPVLKLRRRTH
jgi:hypothetical protein